MIRIGLDIDEGDSTTDDPSAAAAEDMPPLEVDDDFSCTEEVDEASPGEPHGQCLPSFSLLPLFSLFSRIFVYFSCRLKHLHLMKTKEKITFLSACDTVML